MFHAIYSALAEPFQASDHLAALQVVTIVGGFVTAIVLIAIIVVDRNERKARERRFRRPAAERFEHVDGDVQ